MQSRCHILKKYLLCIYCCLKWADGGGGQLVTPDGVAPSRMVDVSACVNLPLHYKVQKFSGTISPEKGL